MKFKPILLLLTLLPLTSYSADSTTEMPYYKPNPYVGDLTVCCGKFKSEYPAKINSSKSSDPLTISCRQGSTEGTLIEFTQEGDKGSSARKITGGWCVQSAVVCKWEKRGVTNFFYTPPTGGKGQYVQCSPPWVTDSD